MVYLKYLVPKIYETHLRKVIQKFMRLEKISRRREINVLLVDDSSIKKYNYKYRKKNKATDVLSFPFNEADILGDIIISISMARRQAKEYDHSLKKELTILLIHGLYHLLGYNHQRKNDFRLMQNKENKLLAWAC